MNYWQNREVIKGSTTPDPWWQVYDRLNIPRRKYYASSIFKHNPNSVMELGCCGGCNIMHFPMDKKIIGLDLNPLAIEYGKETKPWATFLERDITLPFDFLKEPVDIICSMGVLMHITTDRIDKLLTNMLNCCKLGLVLMETTGLDMANQKKGTRGHELGFSTNTTFGSFFEAWHDIPKRVRALTGSRLSVKVTDTPYESYEKMQLIEIFKQ